MSGNVVRVAIAQASPVYLDLDATIGKATRLIAEAGAGGARLVAFPEGFVPGHPLWYHFRAATAPASRDLAVRLIANSATVPGASTDAIGRAAREVGVHVMIGLCERAAEPSGTLYNCQLLIGPDGRLLNHHRKLTPTSGERLVHAPGDAHGLRVVPTDIGRLSGLICGENSNPLAIFPLVAESTQIHVMSWPEFGGRAMLKRADRALFASRAVAFTAKCFVLNAVGAVDDRMRDMLATSDADRAYLADGERTGGSSVIGPDGSVLTGPADHTEGMLFCDLDLDKCLYGKHSHDFAGHYNRSDIFRLSVDRSRREIYASRDHAAEPPSTSAPQAPTSPSSLVDAAPTGGVQHYTGADWGGRC